MICRDDSRALTAGLLILAFLLLPGCIFGPDEEKEQKKDDASTCEAAIEQEIVIKNLVYAYNSRDIACLSENLHPDYTFLLQPKDSLPGGKDFYTRDEDIAITEKMFLAARGLHPDPMMALRKLQLKIYPGLWSEVAEVSGEPCEDCWQTTREYYLALAFVNDDRTYIANELVRFTVKPHMQGEAKIYRLLRCEDIEKNPR